MIYLLTLSCKLSNRTKREDTMLTHDILDLATGYTKPASPITEAIQYPYSRTESRLAFTFSNCSPASCMLRPRW